MRWKNDSSECRIELLEYDGGGEHTKDVADNECVGVSPGGVVDVVGGGGEGPAGRPAHIKHWHGCALPFRDRTPVATA